MKMMLSTIDILEALESDNSRNFKELILKNNKDNHLLRRVFVATGDPYTNYFVKKLKMPPPFDTPLDDDTAITNFLTFLDEKLSTRILVGNAARDSTVQIFSQMSERQQKWCLRILLRNLRVGASESLVEKTWPGAVPKFSVQLAETLGSKHESGQGIVITDTLHYPLRVEPKLDGLRCIAVKAGGIVTLFTRSGSQIETLPTIKSALEDAKYDDFVLDGEIMGSTWNDTASVVMSYKSSKDDSSMIYNVFDAMKFDDWKNQTNDVHLQGRIDLVHKIVTESVGSKNVVQVDGAIVSNENELLKFYSGSMEKGYEGIMLKSLSSPYRFKRTNAVLKLKPVATYEGIIVGCYKGTRGSKREGLWGGFQVLLHNGSVTRCGGGFDDKKKAEIGLDPDAWLGRVIEIEGQPDPLTRDGLTVDGKIRFPVFLRERDPRDVDEKVFAAYEMWRALGSPVSH